MDLRKIVWALLLTGALLTLAQFVMGYISAGLFFRFNLIFLIFFTGNFFIRSFKNIYSKIMQLLSILLLLLSIYFNIGYFHKIDLFLIVVPENYQGKINVKINNQETTNEIKPKDRILRIELENNGSFSTKSNFKVEFNSVIVVKNDATTDKATQLTLSNKKIESIEDAAGKWYLLFTANVENRKE